MGERALRIGLLLLSILIPVGALAAAFAANDWDLKATVMPGQDEIDGVRDKIENMFGEEFSENTFNLSTPTINLVTREIRATVNLTSPFNVDVKITEISGGVSCEQHELPLGSVQMEEQEVNVTANGTATFTLLGALTTGGYQHIIDAHGGDLPDVTLTDMVFEFEFYGVTVRVENMGWG